MTSPAGLFKASELDSPKRGRGRPRKQRLSESEWDPNDKEMCLAKSKTQLDVQAVKPKRTRRCQKMAEIDSSSERPFDYSSQPNSDPIHYAISNIFKADSVLVEKNLLQVLY